MFNCPKIPTVRRHGVSCVLCIVGLYNRCIAPTPVFSFQGVALDPVRGVGLAMGAPAVRPAGMNGYPPPWGVSLPPCNYRIYNSIEYVKLKILNTL